MDSVAAGCWGTINVTVTAPPNPTISSIAAVDPLCGQPDGLITISAFGGTGALTYSLNGVDFKADFQFTGLTGGNYTVTVKDRDQCSSSTSVALKKSLKLTLNPVEVRATTCGQTNGQITLHSEAGNGRITYSIDSLQYQLANTFDNLAAGTYPVSIQDETGCRATQMVVIDSSNGPTLRHIQTHPPTCGMSDGQLRVSATSLRSLRYGLNGMPFQADSSFYQLPYGTYTVTVQEDGGCQAKQTIELGEPCGNNVYLPDSFTPNGDGINDSWTIFFPFANLQLNELTLYNRWGEVVFHRTGGMIKNGEILWNGNYQGVVSGGLYTYQLSVQFPPAESHFYQGQLVLIR
ncbi:hypothetical protein BH09BAC4_BH09BAC4_09800 [soil metagenome]